MTDLTRGEEHEDLAARCAEIEHWHRTGLLKGDTLRAYAERKYPGDDHALQLAEADTAREAFRFVAASRVAAPVAPLAPLAQLAQLAPERTDRDRLDAMGRHRIAVIPEFEGPWDAELYGEDGEPQVRGSGSSPREAIDSVLEAHDRLQGTAMNAEGGA